MIPGLRRHVEWFLCTDFDDHEPVNPNTIKAIIILVVIILIVGGLTV